MSAKTRLLWVYPAIFLASWLAVHALAAGADSELDDPPAPLASAAGTPREIKDPMLETFIGRLAAVARSRDW
jgi:hypothetical protein